MTGAPPIPQSGFVSPNLDEAKRKATQFKSKVDELVARREELAEKYRKSRSVAVREVIALVEEVLDFLT